MLHQLNLEALSGELSSIITFLENSCIKRSFDIQSNYVLKSIHILQKVIGNLLHVGRSEIDNGSDVAHGLDNAQA